MSWPTVRWASALLLAAALAASAGCAGGARDSSAQDDGATASGTLSSERSDDELVVCVSGMVTPQTGLPYYEGLSRYIAEKAGKRLRLIHKAEYAELNELLEQGRVDMAFSCSGPYVTGHDDYGLELLAAPVVSGATTYRAYIIVPESSEATSLVSLEGSIFAFTDPDSNTGCLVPTFMLAVMDREPEEFFDRVIYTYSHDNSIKAVATEEVDGAAVDSLIWDYADDTDPTYTAKTRIVAESDPYGIPPVVVRPGLDPELRDRLLQALLDADEDPEGQALLAKMRMEEFVVVQDADYDSVRDMAEWIRARGSE